MTRLWKILFFFTWLVIIGLIVFLAFFLATKQEQTQQQVINQYLTKGSGLSAYDVAVKNGFIGSEQQWIESLKGQDSKSTNTVVEKEVQTKVIEQVAIKGDTGLSSYEFWLSLGNVGTPQHYLDSLKGADGKALTILIRFNENTGKFETKLPTDTFWKSVASCGGLTGKVCN